MKTIRMPKADLEMVLASLRHEPNRERQGKYAMFDGKGYCCLGLMQCAKTGGKVETGADGDFGLMPSLAWLRSVGWSFKSKTGHAASDPYLPSLDVTAAEANDEDGKTFAEIADAIEACAEGV